MDWPRLSLSFLRLILSAAVISWTCVTLWVLPCSRPGWGACRRVQEQIPSTRASYQGEVAWASAITRVRFCSLLVRGLSVSRNLLGTPVWCFGLSSFCPLYIWGDSCFEALQRLPWKALWGSLVPPPEDLVRQEEICSCFCKQDQNTEQHAWGHLQVRQKYFPDLLLGVGCFLWDLLVQQSLSAVPLTGFHQPWPIISTAHCGSGVRQSQLLLALQGVQSWGAELYMGRVFSFLVCLAGGVARS